MKVVETIHAVGHVLCHDLTQIIPGEFKGARFQKGHIVTEEDVPVSMCGKSRKASCTKTRARSGWRLCVKTST